MSLKTLNLELVQCENMFRKILKNRATFSLAKLIKNVFILGYWSALPTRPIYTNICVDSLTQPHIHPSVTSIDLNL